MELDANGQPPSRVNRLRVSERTIDEMIGLCRGVVADGEITTGEAKFLLEWLTSSQHLAAEWPANILFKRLRRALLDHTLNKQEQGDLFDLIDDIVGERVSLQGVAVAASTSLPLDRPAPKIEFGGQYFCVTGRFFYGSRKSVVAEIETRGGLIHDDVRKSTNYVVIGVAASRDWIHSSFGRKIEGAVALRGEGLPIRIVNEVHWADALAPTPTGSTPAP